MSVDNVLEIQCKRIGRNGKAIVRVKLPGDSGGFTDTFDLTDSEKRKSFTDKAFEQYPAIDRNEVADKLEQAAGECVDDDGEEDKITQSQAIAKLVESAELFNDGENGYATIEVDGPGGVRRRETHPIKGKSFRELLKSRYWQAFKKPASAMAMNDAVETLCGRAVHEGPKLTVAIRVAKHEDEIYIDLTNERWQAVRVTADDWRVIDNPPVRFIRKRGMEALPTPADGGSIDELRPLVNAGSDENFILMVAWLVAALRPDGPYTVLAINGEQGSAKTSTCRFLRLLIDPNVGDLRSMPKDQRDFMIAAGNSHVMAFDNLSVISNETSDSLCRLATGGSFATRALYEDDGEKIFNFCRPIMLNGIDEVVIRPDLLERGLMLSLPAIPEENRKAGEDVERAFRDAHSRILGALLDAVSAGLRNVAGVKLDRLPRMADFAKWVVAAESALPWSAGSFLEAYRSNRNEANALAIEASPIGPAIQALIAHATWWDGTAKDLLDKLSTDDYTDERTRKRLDWPKTPRKLSGDLKRIQPTLRKLGTDVQMGHREGRNRNRIISIRNVEERSSAPSAQAVSPKFDAKTGITWDDSGIETPCDRPPDRPPEHSANATADGADDSEIGNRPPERPVCTTGAGLADGADGADGISFS